MALRSRVHVRELRNPHKGVYPWLATYKQAGAIRKKYFRSAGDAEKFKRQHEADAEEHGIRHQLNDEERSCVVETRGLLSDAGLSLREAVMPALSYQKTQKRSIQVAALIEKFIALKTQEGRSFRHLQDLRSKLGRFNEVFGRHQTGVISGEEITNWLIGLGLSPASVHSYRRILVALFNEAVRQKFCENNPAADSIKPKVIEGEIGILTAEHTTRMLEGADPAVLPVIAIGFFAGLREAELKRLDWVEVDLIGGHVEVKAAKAKSARRRLVQIQPNLGRWLAPLAKAGGPVWPSNGRKLMEAARRAAGFNSEGNPEWPHNALRHSFASYHIAQFQDAAALALELGHADTGIIFRHYRALVRPGEARAYWEIFPKR
ncbi:MAG: integrase [Verrucomicrobiales bacterium]|jgi:integrase